MAPGSRKRAAEDSEDLGVGNINFGASSKKVKPSAEENFMHVHSKSRVKVDANGDHYWEISKLRRVTVSSFRGKTLVNIREYYEKDGKELPGKKGISMPVDQFSSLVSLLPEIETTLQQSGESLPRPDYSSYESRTGAQKSDGKQEGAVSPKKNIEATSEEDESEE